MRRVLTVALFMIFAFHGIAQNPVMNGKHPNIHKIVVKEVLQTTNYTYILGAESDKVQWMAVPKMEAEAGETYYYQGGMQMGEFKSKEMDRVFSSILFLNGLVDPEIVEGGGSNPEKVIQETVMKEADDNVYITPPEGAITIEELYTNKEQYANKVVKIKGRVVKYNSRIMEKNWVHIIDGSGNAGKNDLTATIQEEVKIKDVITLEGIITLDKDFGAGYFYDVIMENAQIVK